ncbi:MAG: histone deacetylase family protein [Thermoproteota archaeon]
MSENIALLYSEKLKNYDFGPGHPFRGERFQRFMSYFKENVGEDSPFHIVLNNEGATDEELMAWHNKEYIEAIEEASQGKPVSNLRNFISVDNVNPHTRNFPQGIEEAARVIVKNGLLGCDLIQKGEYRKAVSVGGGLHHAKARHGEGFCVYNDVVISGKHLIDRYDLERVLILDTDAHAGNGTCEAFYSASKVLLIDLHQKNIYPGTGYLHEIGAGDGEGYTVNIPLPAYSGDDAYRFVFDELVFPLVEEFDPQFVIRNGGSDPHLSDKITQLGLTLEGFRYIGESVKKISENCGGKELDLICSGYTPQVLAPAWMALLSGLAGIEVEQGEPLPLPNKRSGMPQEVKDVVQDVKTKLKPYWKL